MGNILADAWFMDYACQHIQAKMAAGSQTILEFLYNYCCVFIQT